MKTVTTTISPSLTRLLYSGVLLNQLLETARGNPILHTEKYSTDTYCSITVMLEETSGQIWSQQLRVQCMFGVENTVTERAGTCGRARKAKYATGFTTYHRPSRHNKVNQRCHCMESI